MKNLIAVGIFLIAFAVQAQTTIQYPSTDDVTITADLYDGATNDTFIILFHQAGWSRGEYQEIAPKLNKLGYNCLAVDQRSGGGINGIKNNTATAAKKQGKKTKYIHALPDIEASIAYVKKTYNPGKIIIWGSSYSSSLVLKYAGENPDAVNAVLSFSPGEYFGKKVSITESAKGINIPVFITSARNEKGSWEDIYNAIPSATKTSFLPSGGRGNHGSRTLWSKNGEYQEYWTAVESFLASL